MAFGSNNLHTLPIRIAGIVKRLPHNVKVLMSERLFYCYKKKSDIHDNPLDLSSPYYKKNFSIINLNNSVDLNFFSEWKYNPTKRLFKEYTQFDFRLPDSDLGFRDSIFKSLSLDSFLLF